MLILLALVIAVALVANLRIWFASMARANEMHDAERRLTQAQSKIICRRAAEVEALLLPALAVAVKNSRHFMICEGLFLLAEAREELGNFAGAIEALEVSMLHLHHWESDKPAFARLQRTKLAGMLARHRG